MPTVLAYSIKWNFKNLEYYAERQKAGKISNLQRYHPAKVLNLTVCQLIGKIYYRVPPYLHIVTMA